MTVQLDRPSSPAPIPDEELRSPLASGAAAALWAVTLGLAIIAVPIILAWVFAPHSSSNPGDAVRAGALAWLAAQHGSIEVGGSDLSLIPLGLLAIPGWIVFRSGRWAGRVSVDAMPSALGTAGALTATYATVAALISTTVSTVSVRSDSATVLLGAFGLSLVAGTAGVFSGARLLPELLGRFTGPAVEVWRGAAAGLAVLLGGGAMLLAGSLAWHAGRIADLTGALKPGLFGGLVLLILGLLYLPTAVVWASAYSVGPGFAVGIGTSVAPAGVALGPVPTFPLLGALPGAGQAPSLSLLALLTPVVAGVVVGALAVRRSSPTGSASAAQIAGRAALSGVLASTALGVLAWLSAGSVGAVRMVDLGPAALPVALISALEVSTVAAAVAWELGRHRVRAAAAVRWVRTRFSRRGVR